MISCTAEEATSEGDHLKKFVEICANCGKIRRNSKESFKCDECGCDVCVVVPYEMFKQMVEAGVAKE